MGINTTKLIIACNHCFVIENINQTDFAGYIRNQQYVIFSRKVIFARYFKSVRWSYLSVKVPMLDNIRLCVPG